MKTKIINIGNSKGIIVPKAIIEQCGLKKQVSLEVKDNCLIISPDCDRLSRQGWSEAIIAVGDCDKDELLMGDYLDHSWDEEEWTW